MNVKWIVEEKVQAVIEEAMDESTIGNAVETALSRMNWENALQEALTNAVMEMVDDAIDTAVKNIAEGVIE